MSQIKDMGTENEEPGAPITACILRVVWREGRREVLKATGSVLLRLLFPPASTSSDKLEPFIFLLFFPPFPLPPTCRQDSQTPQCLPSTSSESSKGSSETPGDSAPTSEGWKPGGGPSPNRKLMEGTHGGPSLQTTPTFFFFASLPG